METDMGRPMCVLAEYQNPEEILALRGNWSLVFMVGFFPVSVDMSDSRYRVFAKSLTCSRCGCVGTTIRLEYSWHPKGWVDPHFNLYAADGRLMTQDHVIPRSKGGSDEDSNLVTMCNPCNEKKGNKTDAQSKDAKGASDPRPQRARAQAAG